MAYIPLVTQVTNTPIPVAWANQVKDNFATGVPDLYTTKGDLAPATGTDAAARLAAGANYSVLEALSTEATGLRYGTGIVSEATLAGAQSINNNSLTKIQISLAYIDSYSMVDLVNYRITIPAGFPTRYYWVFAEGQFAGHATADTLRHIEIQVDGGLWFQQDTSQDSGTSQMGMQVFGLVSLAATHYIEVFVKQVSGGALNFSNTRLGLFMVR